MKKTTSVSTVEQVDSSKRNTLKGMAMVTASGVLPLSGAAMANAIWPADVSDTTALLPAEIDMKIVSIPDRVGESLLLRNLTDKDISISQFESGRVIFQGDVVDCNDACTQGELFIPANREVLVQFEPRFAKNIDLPNAYLAANSSTYTLPEGTRVVKLMAHMQGKSARLSAAVIA